MTEEKRAFKLRLDGERFQGGRLPVDVLPELQRYERLVVEVAARNWKAANPGRNLPAFFRHEFQLAIVAVEDGSAVPVLETVRSSKFDDYFLGAADEVDAAFAALVAGEEALSPSAVTGLKDFQQFGDTLEAGEAIEFRYETPQVVRYTAELRADRYEALASVAPLIDTEEAVPFPPPPVIAGRLVALNADRQTFTLRDLRKRQVNGRYELPALTDDLRAVLNSSALAPIVRVTGTILRDAAGEALRITNVDAVELFETEQEPWTRRLSELATLDAGWSEGDGKGIIFAALDGAREILRAHQVDGGPFPGIFPMEDGGVLLEWASAESITSVEIGPQLAFSVIRLNRADRTTEDFETDDLSMVVEFLRGPLS